MKTLRKPRHAAAFALLIALAAASLAAREYRSEKYGYFFDPPEGFAALDQHNGDDRVALADESGVVNFNIFAYAGSRYANSGALMADIVAKLKATGDRESFRYAGAQASIGLLDFSIDGKPNKGYAFALAGASERDPDYLVLAYCGRDAFDVYSDVLASAVDSFSPSARHRLLPGPVSQCFDAYPSASRERASVKFLGSELSFICPKEAIASSQALIEQEYRVLKRYEKSPLWFEAWARYYRMIYRDSFARLKGLAFEMGRVMDRLEYGPEETASALLDWLQQFKYVRGESGSDFLSPLSVLKRGAGDCDSLGLVYAILLHHLNIDAVLMLSAAHSHAMVGVDVKGEGARYPFMEKSWLVAELTDRIAIGLIDRDMADPKDWGAVRFCAIPPD
jgi:hypothetical protein